MRVRVEAPSVHTQETGKPDLPSEPRVSEPDEPPPTSVSVKKAGGKPEKYEKQPVEGQKVSRDAGIPESFTVEKLDRRATDESPKARLVYSSDFTKPTGWDESHSEVIKVFRLDGYYHIAVYHQNYYAYFNPPIILNDFRAQVDAEFNIQSGKNSEAGLVFNAYTVDGQAYFHAFSVSPRGLYRRYGEFFDGHLLIADWARSEVINTGDRTNSLMVERSEDQVTVGVNGHRLKTLMASATRGYVGLFVKTLKDDLYAEARFRNFLLYAIQK